jgi:Tfp pilus assembly protein PilE
MWRERGYTIIEVMIFLAVSGALFGAAMSLVSGQQERVRFSQGMRDIDSKIQDVINDVSTGYFPTSKNIKCTNNNASQQLVIAAAAPAAANGDVGQNKDCILLGKVLHFSPGNKKELMNIYSVVGLRGGNSQAYAGGETFVQQIEKLRDAKPTALINGYDATELVELKWGIRLKSVVTGSTAVGVYTSLGGAELTGTDESSVSKENVSYRLKSGSQIVQAIDFRDRAGPPPFAGPSLATTASQMADIISTQRAYEYGLITPYSLCFESSDGKQQAKLTIGQNGRAISTKLEFVLC